MNSYLPRSVLLKRFALIFLLITVVFSLALLSAAWLEAQRLMESITARKTVHVNISKARLTQDFSVVESDLQILENLPLRIRFVDSGKPFVVPREQLQDKKGRYYFDEALKLDQREIYKSPLDLNVEYGRLETPHKPMIRYASPVFDRTERKRGIILINYLGSHLLEHFRTEILSDESESTMLLNHDGYWLCGPRREDEWGFMLGNKERAFGHDFPEAWHAISAGEQGEVQTARGLFAYATVHPLKQEADPSTGFALLPQSLQEISA
jgi:two-component system sensor histidine kinase EvgS